jgi:cysteine desulfurase/selenocysteine lyase
VQDIHCHALVGTGRKYLRGPRGTGFLYVQSSSSYDNDDASIIMPHHVDHYSTPITTVPDPNQILLQQQQQTAQVPLQNVLEFAPRPGAKRFEFWESNISNKLGLGEAVRFARNVGLEKIAKDTQQRANYLCRHLTLQPTVHIHHAPPESGIVTFWVEHVDSAVLKQALWNDTHDERHPNSKDDDERRKDFAQFEVSVVPATSTPVDSSMTQVSDLLRASVSYTTTEEEIDLFYTRLKSLLILLGSGKHYQSNRS